MRRRSVPVSSPQSLGEISHSHSGLTRCSYDYDKEHSEDSQVDGMEAMLKKLKELEKLVAGYREEELESELRWMIYRALNKLCKSKPGKTLYTDILKELLMKDVLPACRGKDNKFVLEKFVNSWSTYKVFVSCFSLVYIQVAGTLNTYTLEELIKVGFTLFRHQASKWILKDSFPEYMKKVEDYLEHEKEMDSLDLHSSSEPNLFEKLGYELLLIYVTNVPETEWDAMLKDVKLSDLARMYRLLSGTPQGLQLLSTTQCMHLLLITTKQHVIDVVTPCVKQIKDLGNDKVKKRNARRAILRKLIYLHDKHFTYVNKYCKGEGLVLKEVCAAYLVVFNNVVVGSLMAKFLANVVDDVVKNGEMMKLSDECIERVLEKVALFVSYLEDRELFEVLYWKKAAYQLLYEKTDTNVRNLKYFVNKLKSHFGFTIYTYKMQRMVADITLGNGTQLSFGEYISNASFVNLGIDFSVSDLNSGYWPNPRYHDLNLPPKMTECIQVYSKFYKEETEYKRKLEWMNTLGTCTIEGNFDTKIIDLDMTTAQASVLLLFDSKDKLTYEEIRTELNISDDKYLDGILHSLTCAKYKILNKVPSSQSISKSDCFEYNSTFTSNSKTIKIPPPRAEKMDVAHDVKMVRNNKIYQTIMSAMKISRRMEYEELKSDCVRVLGNMFELNDEQFEARFEDLVESNLIARDREDGNFVIYIT